MKGQVLVHRVSIEQTYQHLVIEWCILDVVMSVLYYSMIVYGTHYVWMLCINQLWYVDMSILYLLYDCV